MSALQKAILELKDALVSIKRHGIDLGAKSKLAFLNYDASKRSYLRSETLRLFEKVRKALEYAKENSLASPLVFANLEHGLDELEKTLDPGLASQLAELAQEVQDPTRGVLRAKLPPEIREAITSDLEELEKAFHAGCYRSAVMLCGRILEVALHRAYYEATGQDLLEKSPGMGLGTLIARLAERGVKLDPALGNQIHLVNQARIWSVHHKSEVFKPSKNQTRAIILYTLDVLEKLFGD